MGSLSVVLAEAEAADAVAVATPRVPMPVALAGPAAARACGIAEAARPALLAVFPPCPVCGAQQAGHSVRGSPSLWGPPAFTLT